MTNSKIAPSKVIASMCFFLLAIILVIVFTSNTMTKEQMINSVAFGLIATAVGVFLHLRADWIEKNEKVDWNSLSFEERCQRMAADLKRGKRQWFLNPSIEPGDEDEYFAAVLSPKNMNEFGHGEHIAVTKEEVIRLHFNGKIKNPELFNGILTHL